MFVVQWYQEPQAPPKKTAKNKTKKQTKKFPKTARTKNVKLIGKA